MGNRSTPTPASYDFGVTQKEQLMPKDPGKLKRLIQDKHDIRYGIGTGRETGKIKAKIKKERDKRDREFMRDMDSEVYRED